MDNYSHGPVSAAVVFAISWAGLAVINNVCLKRRPGWSYAELTTFCWVRVVACGCEAAAAKHPDRLRNALFEGFYDGGFFLVLVVLYGLFKKWLEEAHNHTYLPFSNLSESTKGKLEWTYTIICWFTPVMSAVGIGAAAASLSGHSNDHDGGASDALHDTSGGGFLGVLNIYLAAVLVVVVNVGRSKMAETFHCVQVLGPLAVVALLLMLKVCFQLACSNQPAAWVNPALFYPLSALPEVLGVIVLTWPGFLLIRSNTGWPMSHAGPVGPTVVSPAGPMSHHQSTESMNGWGPQPYRPASSHQGYAEQPYQHALGQSHVWEPSNQGYAEQPYQQPHHGLNPHHQFQEGESELEHSDALMQRTQHGQVVNSQQALPYQGYPQPAYNQGFHQQPHSQGYPQRPYQGNLQQP